MGGSVRKNHDVLNAGSSLGHAGLRIPRWTPFAGAFLASAFLGAALLGAAFGFVPRGFFAAGPFWAAFFAFAMRHQDRPIRPIAQRSRTNPRPWPRLQMATRLSRGHFGQSRSVG